MQSAKLRAASVTVRLVFFINQIIRLSDLLDCVTASLEVRGEGVPNQFRVHLAFLESGAGKDAHSFR